MASNPCPFVQTTHPCVQSGSGFGLIRALVGWGLECHEGCRSLSGSESYSTIYFGIGESDRQVIDESIRLSRLEFEHKSAADMDRSPGLLKDSFASVLQYIGPMVSLRHQRGQFVCWSPVLWCVNGIVTGPTARSQELRRPCLALRFAETREGPGP